MKNRLNELRTQRGLSLRELANRTGVSFTLLSQIENGTRNLTSRTVGPLASFFNVSVDYLMGYSLEQIFDNFVNTHTNDYCFGDQTDDHGFGDLRNNNDPVIDLKYEILSMLKGINHVENLQLVLDVTNTLFCISGLLDENNPEFKRDAASANVTALKHAARKFGAGDGSGPLL